MKGVGGDRDVRGTGVLAAACVGLALLAAGCGGKSASEQIQPETRLERAMASFEEEDYGDAAEAFREFLLAAPLHPMADSAQYLLAESHFRDEKYIEAAEAFERLAINRPGSSLADDAQLGVCRSYWELSPDLPLDQAYTRQALDACDRMLQYYTPSPLEDRARELRRRARDKIAAKRFRTARWYYEQGAYQSANIYLEDILENHPDAPVVPEVLATLFRSYRELGFDREAREVRRRLLEEHADSEPARRLRDVEPPGTS